jgi:hypothetical protein
LYHNRAKWFTPFCASEFKMRLPCGEFRPNPHLAELSGADRIFATLPTILSSRHEGALLPVELAHGVASLSTYPSARILKVFADTVGGG